MRCLLLTVLLAVGCATPVASRGTLPAAPTDADLANDGSATQQAALLQRYAVRVHGERVDIGDAQRPGRQGLMGTQVHEDVRRYIGDNPDNFPSSQHLLLGSTGLALLAAAVVAAFVTMPLSFLGGLGWIVGLEFQSQWVVTQPALRPNAIPITIGAAFMGTLFVQALGSVAVSPSVALLVTGSVMADLARRQTQSDLEDAAQRHNQQLRKRIHGAVVHSGATSEPDGG